MLKKGITFQSMIATRKFIAIGILAHFTNLFFLKQNYDKMMIFWSISMTWSETRMNFPRNILQKVVTFHSVTCRKLEAQYFLSYWYNTQKVVTFRIWYEECFLQSSNTKLNNLTELTDFFLFLQWVWVWVWGLNFRPLHFWMFLCHHLLSAHVQLLPLPTLQAGLGGKPFCLQHQQK